MPGSLRFVHSFDAPGDATVRALEELRCARHRQRGSSPSRQRPRVAQLARERDPHGDLPGSLEPLRQICGLSTRGEGWEVRPSPSHGRRRFYEIIRIFGDDCIHRTRRGVRQRSSHPPGAQVVDQRIRTAPTVLSLRHVPFGRRGTGGTRSGLKTVPQTHPR